MLRDSNNIIKHTDIVSFSKDCRKASIVQNIAHQHYIAMFLSSDRETGQIEWGLVR